MNPGSFLWRWRVIGLSGLLLVLTLIAPIGAANAQRFLGGGSYSRSGGNENVRWTLADWLTQKQQFKLMDQWLAINRQANMFEFNVEGSRTNYDLQVGYNKTSHSVDRYSASIYISIFGIEGGTEKSDEDTKATWGQFNVRIFGQSSRATHLVLGYGARKWEDTANNNEVTNEYGSAKLQLYIIDFFGIDGTYRKMFNADDKLGNTRGGERVEYGAFLEYQFIRLYGRAFKDTTYVTASGTTEQQTRDGVDAGVKFFF